jgi:signal transduction histidine kinase
VKRIVGLRGRLTAALLALSGLTLAIAAVSLLVPLDRQLHDDALTSLSQTARTAVPTFNDLPEAAIRSGSPQLQRVARDLGRRTKAEVYVLDPRGQILAANNFERGARFDDVVRAIREDRLVAGITSGSEGEAKVAVPLEADGRRFGLGLRKSLEDLSAAQRVVRRSLLIAALIALSVALLGGMALATRLVRRLTALRDTALRVAELGLVAEVHADNTRDEVGDLTRAFATMQQRLREQEQARRTFVATASHELRTPLASLRLMLHSATEELDAPNPDLADARDQLGRALGQTERLGKLAAELLDLSRLDANLPVRSELVELGELARSVIAEFEARIAQSATVLKLHAPESVWAIADPGGAAQILRIVLDNALRHSPPDAPIRVDVEVAGERAALAVSDAGPGVAPVDAERIFQRFERGSGAETGNGFGLGLAIGRELARRMTGDLDLVPGGPGARFVLTLPAAPSTDS